MKTKVLVVIGAIVVSLGNGTIAYAAGLGTGSLNEMLPFMQEMHPNLNDSELEQMYNSCHQQENDNSHTSRMMYNNSMMHH